MPDKSAENLARIRACDADWNENDHPRADNGQFTSGSGGGGAKVSKLQSGGKAKVQNLKNVSGALAGVNAGIEKAKKTAASQFKSNMARGEKLKADVDKDIQNLWDNHQKDWRYGHAYGRLKNKPGMESLAERVKEKGKGLMKEYSDKYDKLMQKKQDINEEYGPDGRRDDLRRKNYEKSMNQLYPQKQALEAEQKKFQGAKATLEKARPGIQAMRQLAKSAAGSKTEEYKNKINADPKLKAEVMSLKGKPAPAQAASPEQSAAKFTKIAETFKKIDPQVAKYAKQAAKIAAKSGEAAALEWAKNKSAEIEADPELWPIAKGFHQGRLRMLTEQYNRSAETPAQNRAPAPAPQPTKKSDVGQKGIDYLRSISHVNSSAEENTGYTARNMIDMINQGKTLKEIRSEMRANIKKHSPDIDGDLQHLDSIIARVKRAQQ